MTGDISKVGTAARFIVFEGGEGSGKSTQAALLAEELGALLTHEPGGTALGRNLRAVLLDAAVAEVVPRAEALLMAADRAQHVEEVIAPTLRSGRHVICDRYTGSSVAYQGAGRALGSQRIADISHWAANGLQPDLVILLVIDVDAAADRMGPDRDRIEAAGDDFHARVRESFAAQAAADPDRWVVIDGSGSVEDVQKRVLAAVRVRPGDA